MKPTLRHLVLATAAAATLTTAGLAMATPHMKGSNCQGQEYRHGHDHGQRAERMQQHMAQRQAQLKEALQLTPAQEVAWQAYTAAMTPPSRPAQPGQPSAGEPLTALQRMERQMEHMQARQGQMNQRLQAMRQLYDTFSPEQRQTFDRHHQPRGRHHPTNG